MAKKKIAHKKPSPKQTAAEPAIPPRPAHPPTPTLEDLLALGSDAVHHIASVLVDVARVEEEMIDWLKGIANNDKDTIANLQFAAGLNHEFMLDTVGSIRRTLSLAFGDLLCQRDETHRMARESRP